MQLQVQFPRLSTATQLRTKVSVRQLMNSRRIRKSSIDLFHRADHGPPPLYILIGRVVTDSLKILRPR